MQEMCIRDRSLLFLAVALAMDAFSAAVTDGMIVKKIRFYDALKVGLFFGVFQFLMPCIGNLVSGFATDIVERFDHWIAFVLLGFLGLHMICLLYTSIFVFRRRILCNRRLSGFRLLLRQVRKPPNLQALQL